MYRKIIAILLISVAAVVLAHVLQLYPPIKVFALKSDDLQFRLFAKPDRADPRIILINVDQASLDHFEKDNIPFPWPRSLYNPIIEYSTAGGAKAVIFDILYNNNSPYGVEVDNVFAAAIRASGRVYLAAALGRQNEGEALAALSRFTIPYRGKAPVTLERYSASLPLPVLLESAAGIGNVNSGNDPDGVFRRVIPFATVAGQLIPSLGAAAIAGDATDGRFTGTTIEVAGRSIPINERGEMLIRFHGPHGTYRSFSAANVINSALQAAKGAIPSIPKDTFRDAYVIVGYTALGLFDNKATPLSPVSPGMEIHANLLDNILNDDFMAPVSDTGNIIVAWLAAVLSITSVLLLNRILAWAVSLFVLLAAVSVLFSQLFAAGYLIGLWSVVTTLLAGLILASAYRYRIEGKDRRFIAKAFGRYVSPQILTELKAHPEKLTLGGKKAIVTLLFSDLEGFTSISENLPPEKVVQFLNLHMSAMTKIIYRHGGTIQTFMGDGIYAFWGAPVENPDQAISACRAAIEMQAENKRLAPELEQAGYVPVKLRIGLNTGPVVVGNMGSEQRFDYTPIGDSVNLAARLEGVNKLYKTEILLSSTTADAIGEQQDMRLVDKVRVKGKDEPIEIFTPCDDAGLATSSESAVMAYRLQDWDRADRLFKSILTSWPGDSIATLYIERIARFRRSPPIDVGKWDGSVTLEKM